MNLGLFIWRFNPPHIWHTGIIKRALKENDRVLVLLWTSLIPDNNNPFDFDFRENLLLKVFSKDRLDILELLDNESDLIWSVNIKQIIDRNYKNVKQINFYGWDFENDSAYKTIKDYEKEFESYIFNYILESRKNSFVEYNWEKYRVSATNLRKALKDWNLGLVEKLCDKEIFYSLI